MKKRFGKVTFEEFNKSVNMSLDADNRWVKLADAIPWDVLEMYNTRLHPKEVYKAYPFRCCCGTLILLERTEMSSGELMAQVRENPYFQYFLGCKEFSSAEVFSYTALVKFPKTVAIDFNEWIEKSILCSREYEDCKVYKDDPEELKKQMRDLYTELSEYKIMNDVLYKDNQRLEAELEKKQYVDRWKVEEPEETLVEKFSIDDLNEEQRKIYDMTMEGKNIFITGGAGTGKSFLLKRIIHAMEKKKMNVVVGAPTGMAALHINGTTLHRLFSLGIGICEDLPVHGGNITSVLTRKAYDVLKAASVLVVDEISMCRADYFSRMARILQYEEKRGHHIQLILCGDFFQLAPVIINREKNYFKYTLQNPEGWAFLTPEWKAMNIPVCKLTTVIRQNNPEFAQSLNKLRTGNPMGLNYIEDNAEGGKDHTISLCGTNKAAHTLNMREMAKLHKPIVHYEAVVEENNADLDAEKEIRNITDTRIEICDGARVIITVNDPTGMNEYHNGSMGVVVAHDDEFITVVLDGEEKEVLIPRFSYKVFGYDVEWDEVEKRNKLKKKVIFAFNQMPVRLGWAITIHKSQGQTYQSMSLETDSLWKVDGLLYVALSRVTDTKGLRLNGGHADLYSLQSLLKTSKSVQDFYGVAQGS